MSATHLNTKAAIALKDVISSGNTYIALGQTVAFNVNVATVHTSTVNNEIDIWNNMISMKKLTYADTSLVIPNIVWAANTIYSPYDHTVAFSNLGQFYVLTSDFRVYKCLDNHNGAESQYEPDYTDTSRSQTFLDGYTWKYMYNLSDKDKLIFSEDDNYIPIHELTGDDGSDQWVIQQDAVSGAVEAALVINTGSGYTANATIEVAGDGAGLVLEPVIVSGNVDRVTVVSRGYGYTWATAVVADVEGSGAIIRPIISPYGGHGSNPVYELNTSRVMIAKSFDQNDGLHDTDFSQLTVVDNLKTSNGAAATATSYNVFTTVATSGSTDFQQDEWVYQGLNLDTALFAGVVIQFDSVSGLVYLNQVRGTASAGSLIGATSGTQRFISSVTAPEVTKYSGHILAFSDVSSPIQRDINQTDTYNMVIGF